jgi:hypothetical protein
MRPVLVLPAFVLALLAAGTLATTMPLLTLEERVEASDLVVRVQVERQWTANIAAPHRGMKLVTFHQAKVTEVLKGAPKTKSVVFGIPGGALGEIAQHVPGAPTLEVGAKALVFLGQPKGPGGARGLVGLWQGLIPLGVKTPPGGTDAPSPDEDVVLERVRAIAAAPATKAEP